MSSLLWLRVRNRYAESGGFGVLRKAGEVMWRGLRDVTCNIYFRLVPKGTFTFQDRRYSYFRHMYNRAFQNERTVEIPIALEVISRVKGKRVLEVGNVLRHYRRGLSHDVLDKYENAPHVINEDVISYRPASKYDCIVSISTMEHVGWDEDPKIPENLVRGLKNLIDNCLAPQGILFVTAPIGYNSYLDELIRNGGLPFSQLFFLKRISADNRWTEVSQEDAMATEYGGEFPHANAILIGIFENEF